MVTIIGWRDTGAITYLNRSLTYDSTDPCGYSLTGNHCKECENIYASAVDVRRVK